MQRSHSKCLIRGTKILLTPEEKIRQNLLAHMLVLGFPKGLISVEKQIGSRRYDIVCYLQDKPLLLIECKANHDPDALKQATGYNAYLHAPFICIADDSGVKTFWNGGESPFLPSYEQLCKALFLSSVPAQKSPP